MGPGRRALYNSGVTFSPGSRDRLTPYDRERFAGDSLFDKLGRALCEAGVLPRKELYESWEVARRLRRVARGGRIVDVGGGHGLLAHVMLLLDDTSPGALVVDTAVPPSAAVVRNQLALAWPRLDGRVTHAVAAFETLDLHATDVVVSCHACGALTDRILERAAAARAPVAVLPCCHDDETCDAGPLSGWLDFALAVDALRAVRLADRGYRVWTQVIPPTITPKNRLLLGVPRAEPHAS